MTALRIGFKKVWNPSESVSYKNGKTFIVLAYVICQLDRTVSSQTMFFFFFFLKLIISPLNFLFIVSRSAASFCL